MTGAFFLVSEEGKLDKGLLSHSCFPTLLSHTLVLVLSHHDCYPCCSAETDDDYDKAEKAIFHGMEQVEQRVQKAVEDEVHSIFDSELTHHERDKVAEHAKTAVKRGSEKAKAAAQEHSKFHFFLPKHAADVPHDDHKILHAVEAAESAVLHAVQEEVEILFHSTRDEHHPLKKEESKKHTKKAKEGVKKGVQKAKKDTEEHHEVRKKWMDNMDEKAVDEYFKGINNMYGLGL